MYNDSYIWNSMDGREELYIFSNVFNDIIENRIILNISQVIVFDFWRRTNRYSIGLKVNTISINPKLSVFNDVYYNVNPEERLTYVKENWKNLANIAWANLYPGYMKVSISNTLETSSSFTLLHPENTTSGESSVAEYFNQYYPKVRYINIYNGYSVTELMSYTPIKK